MLQRRGYQLDDPILVERRERLDAQDVPREKHTHHVTRHQLAAQRRIAAGQVTPQKRDGAGLDRPAQHGRRLRVGHRRAEQRQHRLRAIVEHALQIEGRDAAAERRAVAAQHLFQLGRIERQLEAVGKELGLGAEEVHHQAGIDAGPRRHRADAGAVVPLAGEQRACGAQDRFARAALAGPSSGSRRIQHALNSTRVEFPVKRYGLIARSVPATPSAT